MNLPGALPDAGLLAAATAILARGGLVAFPTETVYGLGADADDPAAVAAIFAAKGRPADHPLIVHLATTDAVHAWAREIPASAWQLAAAFWPGPLSLVLRRSARARLDLTGGQDTVALRCPSHPWARALLAAWVACRGDPAAALAAPSANRFGRISPTTAQHVRAGLGERDAGSHTEGHVHARRGVVDLILDGGPCPLGIESTIVDLTGVPRILRPGAIDAAQLAAVLGCELAPASGTGRALPRVSGQLAQHYAPVKPLELVDAGQLAARLDRLRERRVAVLGPAGALWNLPRHVVVRLASSGEAARDASQLYGWLHELDASDADLILVVAPPDGPQWLALRDRLQRAAGLT